MNLPNFIIDDNGNTLKNYLGHEDKVVVPDNITNLSEQAFFMTSVREVVLPIGVKNIGEQCFWNCNSLVKIELPDTLEVIGKEAFRSCLSLFKIVLPKSLLKIDSGAFYNTPLKKVYYKGTKEEWEKIQMEDGEVESSFGNEHFSNREFLNSIVCFSNESDTEENKECEILYKESVKNYVFPDGYEEYFYKETGVANGSLELCCICFDEMTAEQKEDYAKTEQDPYGMIDFIKVTEEGNHFACAWIVSKLVEGYINIPNCELMDFWGKRFVQTKEVNGCMCYLSYAMTHRKKNQLAIRCFRVVMQYGDANQKQTAKAIDYILKLSGYSVVDVEELMKGLNEDVINQGLIKAKENGEWENFIFLYCVKKSASFTITEKEREECENVCKELGTPNLFCVLESEDSKVDSDMVDELAIIDESKGINEFSTWKECWAVLLFECIEKYTDRNYNTYATNFINLIQSRGNYANQYKDFSVLIALKYFSAVEVGDIHGQENAEEIYKQIFAIAALQGKSDSLVPLKEKPSQMDVCECIYRGELGNFLHLRDDAGVSLVSLKLLGETIEKKDGAYYLKLNLQDGEEEYGVITYQARAHFEVEDNIGSAIITEDVEITDISNMIRDGFFATISDNTVNIDMETYLDVGNDSFPFYIKTIVDRSFNKMQGCTCDVYTTCEKIGKNLVLKLELNFNLSNESEDDSDNEDNSINFMVGGTHVSSSGSEDEEVCDEANATEEEKEIGEDIDWNTITTYEGDCSVFVKFPGTTGYRYNCSKMISVGDKVNVSGKFAGRIGIVDRIGPWDDAPYMQNVVEIIKNDEQTRIEKQENKSATISEKNIAVSTNKHRGQSIDKKKKVTIIVSSIIAIIIAFVIILTTVIIPNAKRKEYLSNGEYGKIVQMDRLTEYTIPEGVESIHEGAFEYCDSLTSVVIPDSVKHIGRGAFHGCDNLTEITLPYIGSSIYDYFGYIFGASNYVDNSRHVPKSLKKVTITSETEIKEGAFYGCDSLTTIIIPDSVKTIGRGAFNGCSSLTNIVIPDSVKSIAWEVFKSCGALTNITIGAGVESIGYDAFAGCNSLTTIIIPQSVKSIDASAFDGCKSLASIIAEKNSQYFKTIDDNLYSKDGKVLIKYATAKTTTKFEIPSTVTSIGEKALQDCSSLTSVVIPNGVTSIGDEAFRGCGSLKSLVIPEGVTSIGEGAFRDCSSLMEITIPFIGKSEAAIGHAAVFGYIFGYSKITGTYEVEGATYQYYEKSNNRDNYYYYYIPNSLKKVNVTSVVNIDERAFYNCEFLTSIEIPNSVKSIGKNAFSYCKALKSIVIPESVTSIDIYAFSCCNLLTSIIIPKSVTTMSAYVFDDCRNLKIYCEASSKPSAWSNSWNCFYLSTSSYCPVVWGYNG